MSQNVSTFIAALIVHFPIKHDREDQEKAWLLSMVRELRGFDANVLSRAAEDIIRHRTDRRFPLPADCRKACLEAKKWLDAEKSISSLPIARKTDERDWSERERLADDMIRCPDGKQAAREGWISALHAFIVRNGRMPNGHEAGACKRIAREFDAAYAECVKGGWEQAATLRSLGEAMLEKRKRLADMVLS